MDGFRHAARGGHRGRDHHGRGVRRLHLLAPTRWSSRSASRWPSASLVDAFVVRMTHRPGRDDLLGEKAWWLPRWLDRILPDVDVEGDRLAATFEQQDHPVHPAHPVSEPSRVRWARTPRPPRGGGKPTSDPGPGSVCHPLSLSTPVCRGHRASLAARVGRRGHQMWGSRPPSTPHM